jgi:hypothetical protein
VKIALGHKRLDKSGGTELDLYRTATGLRDLGHKVHLFCSGFAIDPPEGTFAHSIPVVPLGRTARLWSFASVAPKIIRPYPCDLVMNFGRMFSRIFFVVVAGPSGVFAGIGKRRRASPPPLAWLEPLSPKPSGFGATTIQAGSLQKNPYCIRDSEAGTLSHLRSP